MITQIAIMEIVGKIGGDVRSDTGGQIPGYLRASRRCSRYAEFISRKKAPDVHLVGGVSLHLIVSVRGVEVPLGSEIVIQANHAKIIIPKDRHVAFKFLHVQMVTTA